jgi:hypothetical protein
MTPEEFRSLLPDSKGPGSMNFCTRLQNFASMKNLLILTVFFVSLPITCLRADDKPLVAPRPTEDPMASKKHCQGAGYSK